MASTIVTKNSSTASAVPLTGDLTQGELAVNVTDKRLFTKNSGGTVVELGTNPASLALPNGTANGVAYLNGSKVLTTGSALSFDSSNRLSVNQSSSLFGAQFEVTGGAAGQAIGIHGRASDGIGNIVFGANGSSTEYARIQSDNTSSLQFGVGASGTEAMRLTSTGLGIGTSSPVSRLTLSGTGSGAWLTINRTDSNTNIVDFTQSGSRLGYVGYINNDLYVLQAGASNIVFSTNNNERMRLDSSGNLGLGVTPSAWTTVTPVFQAGRASFYGYLNQARMSANYYYSSGNKYIASDYATSYAQQDGQHQWYTAPSGTAGAAITTFTQAMTLDASGNLGVGTTSPSTYGKLVSASSGTGTTIALVNSSGVSNSNTVSTDYYLPDNTTGLSKVAIIGVDNASATGNRYGNIYFSTSFTGAPVERARIDSSGNLLVGKAVSGNLSVNGIEAKPSGYASFSLAGTTNATDTLNVYSSGASAYRFYVDMAGTIHATSTTISAISDIRFKENVRDLDAGLTEVMALKPRLYDWKEGKGADIKNARGFIAQEFEQVFPDLIDEWKDPAPEGEEPYKSVRQDLIPVLVKAIQEQQALIIQLQADVAALKGN